MAGGNIPANLKGTFVAAGKKYKIDPSVLAGVASVESSLGQDRSTSSAGAVGLMQFLPSTAASIGTNPLNDQQAIFGAAKLLNQYGYQSDPTRAIGAYNGGPGNPQFNYASQVLSEAQRLKGQLSGVSGGLIPANTPNVSANVTPSPSGGGASTTTTGGSSGPVVPGASPDIFGAHASELKYATVWLGAIIAALYLLYLGLNTATHGSLTRAKAKATKTAAMVK